CIRNTPLFTVIGAIICVMVAVEINKAIKLKNRPMFALSLVVSALVPVYYEYGYLLDRLPLDLSPVYLIAIYILALFILMLTGYENTKFSDVGMVLLGSLGLPLAVTVLLYLRDIDKIFPEQNYTTEHGLFLILFAMFCAWISDASAYFGGRFFGKHKLAPKISPKKTIEGVISGTLGCILANVILYAVFDNLVFAEPHNNYLAIIIMSIPLSLIGVCGDLTFSALKRNYEIKDFSNLVPGHGGVMDRFDSEVFVLVALYAIINIFGVVI
ncbi:MAG: hypothetical protein E7528_06825, partial [Ruminococcaceae bacterium]|nr:hypothetical protein [Oscillospiraceae bacterium]